MTYRPICVGCVLCLFVFVVVSDIRRWLIDLFMSDVYRVYL